MMIGNNTPEKDFGICINSSSHKLWRLNLCKTYTLRSKNNGTYIFLESKGDWVYYSLVDQTGETLRTGSMVISPEVFAEYMGKLGFEYIGELLQEIDDDTKLMWQIHLCHPNMVAMTEEIESQKALSSTKFERKLPLAVEGLNPYFQKLLLGIPQ